MIDLHIERTFIGNLQHRLQRFEKKSANVWCARCPICGDSKKKASKKRLYIFLYNDRYWVKCHNCAYAQPFTVFLKEYDMGEYNRMMMQNLSAGGAIQKRRFSHSEYKPLPAKYISKGFDYSSLIDFKELNDSDPAKRYVVDRHIPTDRVLYCPKFSDFIETIGIDQYIHSYKNANEPRMIIPFYRKDGLSTVFQARSINSTNGGLRYITIKEDSKELKIFGLDRVDMNKTVYVMEGPIDAMMLSNAISMSGISARLPNDLNDLIFIFDNEPRNEDVVSSMKKRLMLGNRIVIFPDSIAIKDLNDMVVSGYSYEYILDIISKNTYNLSEGLLRLNKWMRC